MMLTIPETYFKNNEDYITIAAIHKFMRNYPAGTFKLTSPREELLNSIISFGNENENNTEIVLDWIDGVLHEGIKDIYLQYAPMPEEVSALLLDEQGINRYLNAHTSCMENKHLCMNQYSADYTLVSAVYIEEEHGRAIRFTYCKKLHVHDQKNLTTKVIDYPVFADYYLDTQWLLVRAKPRSNLYIYNPNGFKIEEATKTTTEKEIRDVAKTVTTLLRTEKTNNIEYSGILKHKLFCLVNKYTETPKEINDLMDERDSQIKSLSECIQTLCSVDGQCSIPASMVKDVDEDIANIIEKYLSINWIDKNVFIKDRDAYPVQLSATDEEESKVEQTAALEQPLQTKAIFFDNKKMLHKSKQCDGVILRWKRKNPLRPLKDSFGVRISVNNKSQCVFKFSEYTEKEDIENVVFSIINN